MHWRLIALFVGQLAILFCGLLLARWLVPMKDHPFIHIVGVLFSGFIAVLAGLFAAHRLRLL